MVFSFILGLMGSWYEIGNSVARTGFDSVMKYKVTSNSHLWTEQRISANNLCLVSPV